MEYPKIPHDKKKSVKLTIKEIEQIRKDFPTNPNLKLFAEKYNVSSKTIKYWIDEEWRIQQIHLAYIRHEKRRINDNYRQKENTSQRTRRDVRIKNDVNFKKWELEYNRKHKTDNSEKYKKYHKRKYSEYYMKNRSIILQKAKEKYERSKK